MKALRHLMIFLAFGAGEQVLEGSKSNQPKANDMVFNSSKALIWIEYNADVFTLFVIVLGIL